MVYKASKKTETFSLEYHTYTKRLLNFLTTMGGSPVKYRKGKGQEIGLKSS